MKCHVKVLNMSPHYTHNLWHRDVQHARRLPKVNCSIGYEASGMGEDTGLCGIDPDDDTRGTFFFRLQMLAREVRTQKTPQKSNTTV